jgi:uncharacterized protein YkwD
MMQQWVRRKENPVAHRNRRPIDLLLGLGIVLLAADGPKNQPELSKAERTVIDLTNEARAREKLPPLKPNPQLLQAAREHAANMARKGELNHVLDEKGPADRVREAGYRYRRVGENVASGMPLPPAGAFNLWMKSEGHRANILTEEFREIGVGVARTKKGEVYYAQVFGTPLKP